MEHSFIAWAKQRSSKLPHVALGIGDDAALLDCDSMLTVVTTDSIADGTHFVLDECGPRAVGRKAAGVNLSDIAAMGAIPKALFLSLCLPKKSANSNHDPSSLAVEIFEGVYEYAERFQCAIAGGDTNLWNGPLVVSITAIGAVEPGKELRRGGAKPGDGLFVTGSLGGSLLGRHLNVEPRIELARSVQRFAKIHAATDISDGLGVDLLSITAASGCGAEVELDRIPLSPASYDSAKLSGRTALDHALGDGEDFELILVVAKEDLANIPSEIDGVALTMIGSVISRTGLWSKQAGKVKQLPPVGYVH